MSEQVDTKNFDTCRFKSGEEICGSIWCCGENTRKCFICFELNIEDITPNHCVNCKKYQSKITENG